jgi:hypothetical protein
MEGGRRAISKGIGDVQERAGRGTSRHVDQHGQSFFLLNGQGRDKEALALIEKCVQMRKQILGPGHPFTISSQAALNEWRIGGLDLNSPDPHEQAE